MEKMPRGLFIGPLVLAFLALCVGRYWVSPPDVFQALAGHPANKTIESVVVYIRLPRVLLALLVGAGLSLSGAALQAIFNNPLASPDITGVASGASFGAALGLLLFSNMAAVQILALIFGCGAIFLTFALSKIRGDGSVLMIVLSGIIIASLFNALVSFIKYVADPFSKLPAITFWLMGSMTGASYGKLAAAAGAILFGSVVILLMRWRLNALSLGEDEIIALGIHPQRTRWILILCAALIVSAAVSICGQIGWIGLVIPHLARVLVGTDNRRVVPVSISLGAAYMLIIDTIARSLSSAEIPLSILTAILGAPVFGVLFFRKGKIRT
jgi:iron complex transport system permease protein